MTLCMIKHMINQKLMSTIHEVHLQINKKKEPNGFTNQVRKILL